MECKTLAELYTDSFVWDAWSVHDPTHDMYHIYFLMAERQGHHPEDRHNIAKVGHATTPSLTIHPDQWTFHGICVAPQTEDETSLSSLAKTLPTEYAFTVADVDRKPSHNQADLKLLGWRGYDPVDPSIFYGRLILRDYRV